VKKDRHVQVITDELARRGHPYTYLTPWVVRARINGRGTWLWSTRSELTTQIAAALVARKDWTDRILTEAGVSVPEGHRFTARQVVAAQRYVRQLGAPAVVKPALSRKGHANGVTRNVITARGVQAAIQRAARVSSLVLVQRQIHGTEVRVLVIDGRYTGALRKITDPRTGEVRMGVYEGIPDRLHPHYRQAAEHAVAAIPGLGVAGIDMMITGRVDEPGDYAVLEINGAPGIAGHVTPQAGTATQVGPVFVDALEKHLAVGSGQETGGTRGNARTTQGVSRVRD